jgi:integrase
MKYSVNSSKSKTRKYLRFGDMVRYLTQQELRQFFDNIDNYRHKLMFKIIYESGCRVGEFVKIQIKHINFSRSTVFFPAENTKTGYPRSSYLPKGLTNEIKSMLRAKGLMNKTSLKIKKPQAYLFYPGKRPNKHYTENRIRQIFQYYMKKTGLQRIYGRDTKGRDLKMFTVHSLRHSHAQHNVVDRKIPLPIVQKQIGHSNLKTTSIYLKPSSEKIAQVYEQARMQSEKEENFISYSETE